MPKKGEYIDDTGKVFGMRKVWVYVGRDKWGNAMYMCQCECGRIDAVVGTDLRNGRSAQCLDCAKRQAGKTRRIVHKDIDGIEHKYCSSCDTWRTLEYFAKAKKWDGLCNECTFCKSYYCAMRKHGGDLTWEEHVAIRHQPCVLTGIVNPLTISVDRIDSSLPYTLDNVQPMWSALNLLKGTRDNAEFKAMIAPDIEPYKEYIWPR